MKVSLKTKLFEKELNTPFILASGILGTSSDILIRMGKKGAGAVTMKSVGPVEREGHPNPNIIELDSGMGLLNAVGLPSPGYKNMKAEMEELKESPVPVIGSCYGSTIKDFVNISDFLKDYPLLGIELDISCPNKDDGMSFAANPDRVVELVRAVKKTVRKAKRKIPIIPKLTPNTHSIPELAKACKRGGADALCAINTASGMAINIEARKPILAYKKGGVSGPALKPIAVRCVYEAYAATKLPIIGTGGVSNGRDAIEMLMAGASAVGVGSAVWFRGLNAFKEISSEMKAWMSKNNISKISDLIGVAHK